MMRALIFLSLLVGLPSSATDLVLPNYEIDPEKAWVHGISFASKTIGEETHFALEVNEKLFCSIKDVSLVVETPSGEVEGFSTKLINGAYVAVVKLKKNMAATYFIACSKPSVYYNYWRCSLRVLPNA